MNYAKGLSSLSMMLFLSACGGEARSPQVFGSDPKLAAPQRGLLPSMKIAEPAVWGAEKPTVPAGFSITAIATNLNIPRQTLILPNGDILVAEGLVAERPSSSPRM